TVSANSARIFDQTELECVPVQPIENRDLFFRGGSRRPPDQQGQLHEILIREHRNMSDHFMDNVRLRRVLRPRAVTDVLRAIHDVLREPAEKNLRLDQTFDGAQAESVESLETVAEVAELGN